MTFIKAVFSIILLSSLTLRAEDPTTGILLGDTAISAGAFPSHSSNYGLGGWHITTNQVVIPPYLITPGTAAWNKNEQKLYVFSTNSVWIPLESYTENTVLWSPDKNFYMNISNGTGMVYRAGESIPYSVFATTNDIYSLTGGLSIERTERIQGDLLGSNYVDYSVGVVSSRLDTVSVSVSNLVFSSKYWPQDSTPENFFSYTTNDNKITITDYDIAGGLDVKIPDYINGIEVNNITNEAFAKYVELPGGFFGNKGLLITSIRNDSVVTIGNDAFRSCTNLISISFTAVTSVNNDAFSYCTKLKSVYLPNVVYLGDRAFAGNEGGPVRVELPNVKTIKRFAFIGNTNMSYFVADKVELIGTNAFYNCPLLTSLNFPAVTNIQQGAFSLCLSLHSIYFSGDAPLLYGSIYNGLPLNQVTNYVINPIATGWTNTLGGMPVIRPTLHADGLEIGPTINNLRMLYSSDGTNTYQVNVNLETNKVYTTADNVITNGQNGTIDLGSVNINAVGNEFRLGSVSSSNIRMVGSPRDGTYISDSSFGAYWQNDERFGFVANGQTAWGKDLLGGIRFNNSHGPSVGYIGSSYYGDSMRIYPNNGLLKIEGTNTATDIIAQNSLTVSNDFQVLNSDGSVLFKPYHYAPYNSYQLGAGGGAGWAILGGINGNDSISRIDLNASQIFLNGALYPQGNVNLTAESTYLSRALTFYSYSGDTHSYQQVGIRGLGDLPTRGQTYGLGLFPSSMTWNHPVGMFLAEDYRIGFGTTSPEATIDIRPRRTVQEARFYGSGLNDLEQYYLTLNEHTGTSQLSITVMIDSTGTPDTFKWSTDGGVSWVQTGIALTGSDNIITNGINIRFSATTGHTLGDYWLFDALYPDPQIWRTPMGTIIAKIDSSGNMNVTETNTAADFVINDDLGEGSDFYSVPSVYRSLIDSSTNVVVTANQSVYKIDVDSASLISNDLSQLDFVNQAVEYKLVVNIREWAATGTTFAANFEIQNGGVEFSVTGEYQFACSSLNGSKILLKQEYPTVHEWSIVHIFNSYYINNPSSHITTGGAYPIMPVDSTSSFVWLGIDFDESPIMVSYGLMSGWNIYTLTDPLKIIGSRSGVSTTYTNDCYQINSDMPFNNYKMIINGKTPKSYDGINITATIASTPTSQGVSATIELMGTRWRKLNELEIRASAAGWRP